MAATPFSRDGTNRKLRIEARDFSLEIQRCILEDEFVTNSEQGQFGREESSLMADTAITEGEPIPCCSVKLPAHLELARGIQPGSLR